MWGLEHSEVDPSVPTTVKSHIARYSYGMCSAVPFIEGEHQAHDRVTDQSSGMPYAKDQMLWFIEKVGILLVSSMRITAYLYPGRILRRGEVGAHYDYV